MGPEDSQVCSPPPQLATGHWLAALWQAETSIAYNACSDTMPTVTQS